MRPVLKKVVPISLRSAGLDEKWLQDQIAKDPTLLGLGGLEIVSREHRQPFGGRIDFLMRHIEEETYFEVEVMLGALDASHIIRAIEYWDIERQRRPNREHRAVIVAEQITSRFFNVLRLLNRAVPLIAIKLAAFQIGDEIFLHPVTVLDIIEEVSDDSVDPVERSDRPQWEKKSPWTLGALDFFVAGMQAAGSEPKITYNRGHIAIGSSGYNFCWLNPRKSPRCNIEMRIGDEDRDLAISQLQDVGIDARPKGEQHLALAATLSDLESHSELLHGLFSKAEFESR